MSKNTQTFDSVADALPTLVKGLTGPVVLVHTKHGTWKLLSKNTARRNWAKEMHARYCADKSAGDLITNYSTRQVYLMSPVGGKILATAECNPKDEFDTYIGGAVAIAKHIGEPIPDYI